MVPYPTEEEFTAIKRLIIIPLILSMLQRDKKVIAESALKTKEPYLSLMDSAMKKAHGDIYETRVFLRSKGIKIYEEKKTETAVAIKYTIKGYQYAFSLPWYVIKSSVESMIKGYLGVLE